MGEFHGELGQNIPAKTAKHHCTGGKHHRKRADTQVCPYENRPFPQKTSTLVCKMQVFHFFYPFLLIFCYICNRFFGGGNYGS